MPDVQIPCITKNANKDDEFEVEWVSLLKLSEFYPADAVQYIGFRGRGGIINRAEAEAVKSSSYEQPSAAEEPVSSYSLAPSIPYPTSQQPTAASIPRSSWCRDTQTKGPSNG
jgi:hypothetical protein